MFDNLIESRAAKQRKNGATAFSAVLHAVLIGAAVYLTYHADQAFAKPKAEKVDFVTVKKDPPPPKEQPKPPPDVVVAPPPPKGFQILTAPIKIPDVIPDVDLTKQVTREEDFTGKGGIAGGTASGVAGGVAAPIQSDQTYFEFQVEKQAALGEGNTSPPYPAVLRSGNIEGQVLVSFVVDTNGHADMATFTVVKTTHDLFTAAVKQHLPQMKFVPAEIGGHKVKQLVQMPFQFTLNK